MSKHIVITGANRGIGLAFCQHYLAQGNKVTAVVRKPSDTLMALGCEVISGIDVSNENSVSELAKTLNGKHVDVLINNAGIFSNQSMSNMNFTEVEHQFMVNALAPVRVTHALMPNLSAGSKVAMITSRMGSIEDNSSGHYIGYRMSKAALNAASKSMAIELAEQEISLAILHPGFVQTEMVGFAGDVSPEIAAERLIQRINELNLTNTGSFWHANGELLPW